MGGRTSEWRTWRGWGELMATVNVVRLRDSDIEQLAAVLDEKMGTRLEGQLAEIIARLAEKRAGRKKAVGKRGDE